MCSLFHLPLFNDLIQYENSFCGPQMNDLDNEDSKKDTLVDVVFKKALKEFRQNIFSFYSSALAVISIYFLDQCTKKVVNTVEDNTEAMFN